MAKRLNIDLPDEPTFPWDEWFNGDTWELTMEDFPTFKNLVTVRAFVHQNAREHMVRVVTRTNGEVLQIQSKGLR